MSARTRIGIDARKAGDYGIGTYIRNLTNGLVGLFPECRFVLFHRPGEEDLLPRGENVTLRAETAGNYSLRELFTLSAGCRETGVDLFHAPHYILPFRLPCPAVVTIHDLIHLLFPEYLPHPLYRHYARYMIGRAVNQAASIITVSRSSREDILKAFPGTGTPVRVIPNGVEGTFTPRPLAEAREWLASSLDLKGDYLLFVGNPKRHKNLELLLQAFSRLQSSYVTLDLVVVGGSEDRREALKAHARSLGAGPRVRFFGTVDAETLALLYSAATVFVFPSRYEGFGLPPLEAISCGAPVVASTSSSIPEVLGPAAVYFSPDNVDSLMNALCTLLDDPQHRDKLTQIGKKRALLFSWESTARETMQVYRSVLGG